MEKEKMLFDESLQKLKLFWKLTGMQISNEGKKSFISYILGHWFYILNFAWLNCGPVSFFTHLHQMKIQDIFYMIPCITFVLLGDIKSMFFLKNEDKVYDVIDTIKALQMIDDPEGKEEAEEDFLKRHLPFMNTANNVILFTCIVGVTAFCVGPVIIIGILYWSKNEIDLFLPFPIWYPFDVQHSFKGWLVAYVHQVWSAWVASFYIYGSDRFFYTTCAFINGQFYSLKYDLERIGPESFKNTHNNTRHMNVLIHRHRELIRCVDMLNIIYEKSTLFNVVSSSFIICLAGFNVKSIDNFLLVIPFAAVTFFGLVQTFCFCYYGDLLMRSSEEISDAVFNGPHWYHLKASSMKSCLFIMMRARKPCYITAFGFSSISLVTFARILSSSWSYFTLLNTMVEN